MNLVTRRVEVTKEDIAAGQPGQCEACPVYFALCRTFPEFDRIVVHEKDILVQYQGWSRNIAVPEEVESFIRTFDDTKVQVEVQPFSFDLGVYV